MALSRAAGDRLLAASRRAERAAAAQPGVTLGLEHEFVVRARGDQIDFREVLDGLELPGLRIDPGDRYAYRLPSGIAITADVREAEIALPPLRRRTGYAATLQRRADVALRTLRAVLPAEYELEGYSTHLSLSMPGALNDAVCQLYARRFSAAAILLMDAAGSDGLLLRPRPGRTELGVDYLVGARLRVAALFAVASVRASAGAVAGRANELPRELRVRVDEGVERFGWYVDRRAFGDDLLINGRDAQLVDIEGSPLTGQDALGEAWHAIRPWLDGTAEADIALAERMINGDEPLPHEVPRSSIAASASSATKPVARLATPFGEVVRPRQRGELLVTARLATWDYTVFAVAYPDGRQAFISVPAATLALFLKELDRGGLDAWLTESVDKSRLGQPLLRWEQTQRLEVFASVGGNPALVRPERATAADARQGDRAGKAGTGLTVKPEETRTGGGPSWLKIGGGILIGLTVLLGGWIGLTLMGGGGTQPSPTPPVDACIVDPGSCVAETPTPPIDSCIVDPGSCVAETPTPPIDSCIVDPGSCVAETPTPPIVVITIDDYLTTIGLDETQRTELVPVTLPDEISDWNEPSPAVDAGAVDITGSLTVEANLTPEFLAQFPACGAGTICASDASGVPGTTIGAPGDYVIHLMQMRGTILGFPSTDTGFFELGVVGFDTTPAGGGQAVALDRGPNSFLTGSNAAYTVQFALPSGDAMGVLFRFVHGASDSFLHEETSTAFALVRGNVLGVFIPDSEWEGTADFRLYSYYQVQNGSVSDTVPQVTEPMTLYRPGTLPDLFEGLASPTPGSLSVSNRVEIGTVTACTTETIVTWYRPDGVALAGTGTVVIEGPTDAGTREAAAQDGVITLDFAFPGGNGTRTWTVTLESVDGVQVRGSFGPGSTYTFTRTDGPACG